MSDLPDELFFVAQIDKVEGRRPERVLTVKWLDHIGKRNILFGNGEWKLNGNIISYNI